MEQISHVTIPLLSESELREFFVDHLNRIYCAKSHLVRRFPELAKHASFVDLKNAILETKQDVENQISRMGEILMRMGQLHLVSHCKGMIAMLEEAFDAVHEQKELTSKRDMAILYYMHSIESVEMASFQILRMAAVKMKDPQISQLLQENYDESKEDRTLILMITTKYLVN